MDTQQKCLRIGAVAVGLSVLLRLVSVSGISLGIDGRELASAALFLTTGRMVRLIPSQQPEQVAEREDTPQTESRSIEPVGQSPVFTAQDAALVELRNTSGYTVDVEALMEQSLSWDLTQEGPTVLILHTHGSESYTKTEDYTESAKYRTLDERYNMVSIGERLAQQLEAGGIGVVHDRTLHDQPSYNGSYNHARGVIEQYLQEYPTICMVLDMHRDAAQDTSGNQIGYTVQTEYGNAAKLMLVMGTDSGGLTHPQWQENLALAVKLHAALEKRYSGICRPMHLRTSRFNQDLCPGALLVEVGAAGNTRQEALVTADILAQEILALAHGIQIDN